MVEIKTWDDPAVGKRMFGEVYGHPHFTDGTSVITTVVTEVTDKGFSTKSGTEYEIMRATYG